MKKIILVFALMVLTINISAQTLNNTSLANSWNSYTTNVHNRVNNFEKIIAIQGDSINKLQSIITIMSNQNNYLNKNIKSTKRENLILKIIVTIFTGLSLYGVFKATK